MEQKLTADVQNWKSVRGEIRFYAFCSGLLSCIGLGRLYSIGIRHWTSFIEKNISVAFGDFVEDRARGCVLCGAKQFACRTVGYLALCLGHLGF